MRYISFSLSLRLLCALALLLGAFAAQNTYAQRLALKTNALEYLTLSPNLTLEARLSRVLTLQLGLGGNPITKPIGDFKATNFRVEPELRYWFNRPMARHFVTLSATAGFYNLQLKDRLYQGDVIMGGISYGYALVLSRHWNMEAEIGVGLGQFHGYHYNKATPRPRLPNYRGIKPVPVRFALSFGYIFK